MSARLPEPERVTPRTWPENAWPTAVQLAEFLKVCTDEERVYWAQLMLTDSERATLCRIQHSGQWVQR